MEEYDWGVVWDTIFMALFLVVCFVLVLKGVTPKDPWLFLYMVLISRNVRKIGEKFGVSD